MGKIICWLVWWPRCKFIFGQFCCPELIYYSRWHNVFCAHTHTEQRHKQGYSSIRFLTSELTKAAPAHDPRPERFWAAQQGRRAAGQEQQGRAVPWLQASACGTGQLHRENPRACTAALPARAAPGRIQPGCGWRCSPTAGGFQHMNFLLLNLGVTRIFNTLRFVI